jgi:hypothetical protein
MLPLRGTNPPKGCQEGTHRLPNAWISVIAPGLGATSWLWALPLPLMSQRGATCPSVAASAKAGEMAQLHRQNAI